MSVINKHKKVLRVIVLALMGAAIIGPWLFDVIHVPSEYSCTAPNIRIKDDFCGLPLSGITIFSWMISGFIYAGNALVSGSMDFYDLRGEFFSLFLFLILLPFFSTLLLILGGDRRRLQIFNVVALGFSLGLCLLLGLSDTPKLFWVLWGVWLYIGAAAAALILEILLLKAGRGTYPSQTL